MAKRSLLAAVIVLLVVQAALVSLNVHRESLTFDEDNHMFAGYMMWKTGDYGLNPEHPPLVKLLAALPIAGARLWLPPLQGRDFKIESYLDGRDWLAHNDGASQRLVFRMRLAAGLLALGLTLVVFIMTREFFGDLAGLIAMVLVVFEPNILAHSGLVTTDIGASVFFLASIYAFYRYAKRPSWLRFWVAGLATGLLLATKHSGVLLGPMLMLLMAWEIFVAPRETRARIAVRSAAGIAGMFLVALAVLWSFYGFRYAARPAGLVLNPSLNDYLAPLKPFKASVMHAVVRVRLLPESYLMGLIDVKRVAGYRSTYALGHVYAHGQWWYFPIVILIKSTLGMLALLATTLFAIVTGKLRSGRELAYLFIPLAVYLGAAMTSGMNIGARHILPAYALAAVLAAGGAAALMASDRRWAWACGILLGAHVASTLSVYPNTMAYANEAWGGPKNSHLILSDSNVDWGQQLYQVKAWQDHHPGQECWFVYMAWPVIDPSTYGVHCHHLPTENTQWLGQADITPLQVNGTVLISGSELRRCERRPDPYCHFQALSPEAVIDDSVFAYTGSFDLTQAAALSRAQSALRLLVDGKPEQALALARDAVAIDPTEVLGQTALGNAAAAMGQKDEARAAWKAALELARRP
jgi:4-amino-4-deoxy-L-arabinose transferase-like glycosyltransferase